MDLHVTKTEKLWPIVEPDHRFPFPPAIWATLNIFLATLITFPFLFTIGSTAVCCWTVDAVRALFEAHIGYGIWPSAIATVTEVFICLFAMLMQYLLVVSGGVRYLVREARHALRDCDPLQLLVSRRTSR